MGIVVLFGCRLPEESSDGILTDCCFTWSHINFVNIVDRFQDSAMNDDVEATTTKNGVRMRADK